MSDLEHLVAERVRFLTLAGRDDVVLHVAAPIARLQKGQTVLPLRLDPRALPLRDATLSASCSALSLRACCAGQHDVAFAELLRATRPEGRAIIAEDDESGTVGAEHRTAAQAGWVASPMEAIAAAHPRKIRVFVAFRPAADKSVAAERGHKTH